MTNFLNEEQSPPRTTMPSTKQLLMIILILLILAVGGAAYWYFDRAGGQGGVSLNDLPPQQQLSPEEIQDILQTIGRHIVLPDGEPLIATIQDAEALKKVQPFFGLSQNGDQLLVYADQAFLYRPSADKLVNVGPVYRSDDQSQGAVAATSQDIKLELRNGSKKTGAARALADQLAGLSGYSITQITNAATSTYAATAFVNLTNKNISGLQQKLEGAAVITQLPTGEAASTADVVLIVGNDRVSAE